MSESKTTLKSKTPVGPSELSDVIRINDIWKRNSGRTNQLVKRNFAKSGSTYTVQLNTKPVGGQSSEMTNGDGNVLQMNEDEFLRTVQIGDQVGGLAPTIKIVEEKQFTENEQGSYDIHLTLTNAP